MDDELLRRSLEEYDDASALDDGDDIDFARPQDDQQAAAMLRQIAWIEREIARIVAVAQSQIDHAASWRSDMTNGLKRRKASIERALEGFARARARKTTPYPYGSLKLRARNAVVVIDDEAAFFEHVLPPRVRKILEALSQSELLNVTVTPVKQAISKQFAAIREADEAAVERAERTWAAANNVQAHPNVEVMALADSNGQPVPGVHLVRPLDDSFTISIQQQQGEAEQ